VPRRDELAVGKCNDDAGDRPGERTQRVHQPDRIGFVADVSCNWGQGAGRKSLLQFAEPVPSRGNRDDRTPGVDHGANNGPADCPGGANDDDRRLDCPRNGMDCPVGGTIEAQLPRVARK
jgi:hypothetical protein